MATSTTDRIPAARTRSVLLVLVPSITGIFFHILYGPAPTDPPAFPVMGLVGFAGAVVVALMLGWVLGAIADRRSANRGDYYRERR